MDTAESKSITVSPMFQVVRIGLLLFTAVFWITGFCLFVIGIWSVVKLNQYDELPSHNNYNSVAVILIVIGLFIASVGFCGWCGALRKSACLLKTFALFLAIIILCEVCAAVAGYAYRSKIKTALSKGLNSTMQDYKGSGAIRESWDKMQENLQCCGNKGYGDWFNVAWNKNNDSNSVPKSCCVHQDNKNCSILHNVTNTDLVRKQIYVKGCFDEITDFFQSKFSILASGALGVALVQIIGVVCSGCLWTHIQKKTKYELV